MATETTGKIWYTGAGIDRAERMRRDSDRVAEALERDETLLILSDKGKFLVWDDIQRSTESRVLHSRGIIGSSIPEEQPHLFLGLLDSRALFAVDISESKTDTPLEISEQCSFVDLRRAGLFLSGRDSALLAYARSLLNWHRNTGFCPRCGSRTASRDGGYRRLCLNEECSTEHYPRIDPAVIMLVERSPTATNPALCLLGRRHGWPATVYSTLAGFVESGESLEEAVAREVNEESGVRIDTCRYQGSQPWPFPGSLMLGFRARAATTEIVLDRDELADARWFSRDELRAAGDWGEENCSLCLPRRDSIARYLIDSWLGETE